MESEYPTINEQKMFKFISLIYQLITTERNGVYIEIHQINLSKLAEHVGLKSVPTQDQLYTNIQTGSAPTMEDAKKILQTMREVKHRTRVVPSFNNPMQPTEPKAEQPNEQSKDELSSIALKNAITENRLLKEKLELANKKMGELSNEVGELREKNKELVPKYNALLDALKIINKNATAISKRLEDIVTLNYK